MHRVGRRQDASTTRYLMASALNLIISFGLRHEGLHVRLDGSFKIQFGQADRKYREWWLGY